MIRSDIQKKLDEIKDIKLNMRNSIHSRDVDIDADTLFKDYPHKIDEIPDPNYLYAISGNWDGELDTMYFNPDVHYIPTYTGVQMDIRKVILHKDISEIGDACFVECRLLRSVNIYSPIPPVLGAGVFTATPSEMVIRVPLESLQAYKSADGWSDFASQIEVM